MKDQQKEQPVVSDTSAEKQHVVLALQHLGATIGYLSRSLGTSELGELQQRLQSAHTLASTAVEEIQGQLQLVQEQIQAAQEAEEQAKEEFRYRLAHRDRDASYKAFKKSSAELRQKAREGDYERHV